MGLFVKICGVCSESDLKQVAAAGPDAVGFVQWSGSPRHVAPEAAGQWETPPSIKRVGVFVGPSEAELAHAAQHARLDVLQLHRVPDNFRLDRSLFRGLEVWRALNPDELYYSEAGFRYDRFLLDSYDPRTVGGTGKTCDWNKARALVKSIRTPVLLAGGLNAENVAEAVAAVQPWGVDVSSGVETAPGAKDIAQVEAFVAACRK